MTIAEDINDLARLRSEAELFLSVGNPDATRLRQDPYPFMAQLTRLAPVLEVEKGLFVVTSWGAANEVLHDRAWSRVEEKNSGDLRPTDRVFYQSLAFVDPPAHDRLKRLVNAFFTPSAIQTRRETVTKYVHELLDAQRDAASFDFRTEVALPLPLQVIDRDFLGLPPGTWQEFEAWTDAFNRCLDAGEVTEAELLEADLLALECEAFFEEHIEYKRKHPGNDLISLLVNAGEQDHLSHTEIISMCMILHVAGYETTAGLLTNGLYQLNCHPDAYEAIRSDPALVPNAVEEMLRFDSPSRGVLVRIAPQDTELEGVRIPKGGKVWVLVAAANRDPQHFTEPAKFDIQREVGRHIAFGYGIHFCLGSHLALLEARETFHALAVHYPRLIAHQTDVAALAWKDSFVERLLLGLTVSWEK